MKAADTRDRVYWQVVHTHADLRVRVRVRVKVAAISDGLLVGGAVE
jgi:hypothetical protein